MKYPLIVFTLLSGLITGCDWYGAPGSGLGTNATVEVEKYKTEYRRKYGDSLKSIYTELQVPDSTNPLSKGMSFLNMQPFHLTEPPEEIYYIQWSGTGFIEVRMAYDLERNSWIDSDTTNSKRIKQRFENEILSKIDSLISISVDKDSAVFISPWVEINKKRQEQSQ